MPRFSQRSYDRLKTCHIDLQNVLFEAIKFVDFTVIAGHRSDDRQNELFDAGLSKTQAGESKHNRTPSEAVDIAPYPVNWNDTDRFYYFAGFIMAVARKQGVPLRWGGDWDQDTQVNDQSFMDLGHFELMRS